jgi:hypothetical protein
MIYLNVCSVYDFGIIFEKYGAKEALKCRHPPKSMRRIGISTIHKPLHAALASQFLSLGKIR